MPPVLGPASSSPTRLKSWAGISGTTVVPSLRQNSDTSGPDRYSSMTTAPSGLARQARACSSASARSSVTTTPLPAASPSSLTTCGAPNASSAASTSSTVVHTCASPVGTSAADMTSLAKALLPSSRAACADGPKHGMPAARTASATPATSGASGPMTTRSTPSDDLQGDDPRGVGDPAGERHAPGHRPRCRGSPVRRRRRRPTDRARWNGRWRARGPLTRRRVPSRDQSSGGRGVSGMGTPASRGEFSDRAWATRGRRLDW